MRNQSRQRVNCVSQQPTSHASVIWVSKGQTEHLKPLIYLPVHVLPLVLDKKPQTFYCNAVKRVLNWKSLHRNINHSLILCRNKSSSRSYKMMADGAGWSLIERPAPPIRGYINLHGCIAVGNHICDGSVLCTLYHLSVWLPVCHTDMSWQEGRESNREQGGRGLAGPELLITWVLGEETITRVWQSEESKRVLCPCVRRKDWDSHLMNARMGL